MFTLRRNLADNTSPGRSAFARQTDCRKMHYYGRKTIAASSDLGPKKHRFRVARRSSIVSSEKTGEGRTLLMTDTACVSARIARQVCCPVVMANTAVVQHTGQGSNGNRASRRQ